MRRKRVNNAGRVNKTIKQLYNAETEYWNSLETLEISHSQKY